MSEKLKDILKLLIYPIIVIVVGSIIVSFVNANCFSKSPKNQSETKPLSTASPEVTLKKNLGVSNNLLELSPSELIADIREYPLAQQENALKNYIDLWVNWNVKLSRILDKTADNDSIELMLMEHDTVVPFIYCWADLNEHKRLNLLHEGDSLQVDGRISGFRFGYGAVYLDDCRFEIK